MTKRFSRTSSKTFLRKTTDRIARLGARIARRNIPSVTLSEALVIVRLDDGRVNLHIPHYWAVWLHDGRGPVTPQTASVLVWFEDPKDDPRVSDGYPVLRSDVKRLTRAQWLQGLRENRKRRKAGRQPFMIVTKYSGPTQGKPFFTDDMESFEREAASIATEKFDRFIREHTPSEKLVAEIRLR